MTESPVAILVPRRAGIADRDRLWDFARTWWERDFPDWELVEGHHDVGPFNRSAAINDAAHQVGDWGAAVIIDADVLADPDTVRTAVDVALATDRMVLAYNERIHLSQKGTERVLAGFQGNWKSSAMVSQRLTDSCSSCVVVSRALWDKVAGFDERFEGWGWEDVAFRIACETFSGRPMITLGSTLWHLWHRTSHENNRAEPTFVANKARGDRYKAAHMNEAAVQELLDEAALGPGPEPAPLDGNRIPRIFHRTVPAETDDQIEAWWNHLQQLHPGWEFRTWRDPLDRGEFPETGDLFDQCTHGAQLAGLVRLEVLYKHGGIYVDSDVEPYRSFEPLLANAAFAGWEDNKVIPDAVLGAEPGHPAFRLMIDRARASIEAGGDPWASGPGVTTSTLNGRHDVLVLPPGCFYPYHYTKKAKGRTVNHRAAQPWAFCAHHWNASWVPKR